MSELKHRLKGIKHESKLKSIKEKQHRQQSSSTNIISLSIMCGMSVPREVLVHRSITQMI